MFLFKTMKSIIKCPDPDIVKYAYIHIHTLGCNDTTIEIIISFYIITYYNCKNCINFFSNLSSCIIYHLSSS